MRERLWKKSMLSKCRQAIALLLAMVMMATMSPVFVNAETSPADELYVENATGMKTISVAVYDYAAKAEGFGVSKDGVILAPYQVTVSEATLPLDIVIKALSENNIPYENEVSNYGNYIKSIGGLGPNDDPKYISEGGYSMAGWRLSHNNDDYDNSGLDKLDIKDGDSLRFDYQTFGPEIADKYSNLPTMDWMEIGGVKVSFTTTTQYDADYNYVIVYKAEGTDATMTGEGTKENPFILSVVLDSSVDLAKVPVTYKTKALEPYRKVAGLDGTMDLTKEQAFTVTSNGNRTAYYTLKATKKEAPASNPNEKEEPVSNRNQKQEITGVKDSYKKTYGAKAFTLQAAAKTGLTYESADKKVAAVDKNGKVTVKGCGETIITITAAGEGYESVTKSVKITVLPKKQRIKAASKKKGRLTVTLNKNAKISGYEIIYSTSKKFLKKKTKKVTISANGKKNVTKNLKKLITGKTYYVKARAFKTYQKKKYYGNYSTVTRVKVK